MSAAWQAGAVRRCLAGLIGGLLAALAAAQELPEVLETVEVRVVNVDVVVTDGEGRPVRGLERDDFELRVDGRPVPVEYFSPVADGETAPGGAVDGRPPDPPYLAIVYDGRAARPAGARRTIGSLLDRLDGLLASSRAVMVLRQATGLVIEEPMTRDRERLAAALERLGDLNTPALNTADRKLLLLQLESSDPPRIARESEDALAADRAKLLLRQIRTQAEVERFAAEESSRQLRSLVRSLSGLPGRKAILLLGEGFTRQPAEPLFRIWWSKFSRYGPRIGVTSIESELGRVRSDQLFDSVVDEANAHRVTFYTYDPEGLRVTGSSAEYASLEANLQLAQESEQSLDSLAGLAMSTGGLGRVRAGSIDPLLSAMLDGFRSYYSLGFTPGEIEGGRVEVRLRGAGLRPRYLRQFAVRTAAQRLEEATLATLLTAAEENPLQVGVEMGEAEPQEDGTFLVPVLVKVPMVRLSLVPQSGEHVGRLSFVVMAQGADGGLSQPAGGMVPIRIDNAELVSAMGRMAGYRLQLRTGPGEQVLAIGVRDEVARQDATLRLVLTAGWGA